MQPNAHDPAAAHRLWLAAMEQYAALERDSALTLLRKAFETDPAFLPAALDYDRELLRRTTIAERSRLARADAGDPALGGCLAAVVSHVAGNEQEVLARLRALEKRIGPSDCTRAMIAPLVILGSPLDGRLPMTLEEWEQANVVLQGSAATWTFFSQVASAHGDTAAASRAIDIGLQRAEDPLGRLDLLLLRRDLRRATGDSAGARALDAAIAAAVARDGRDGIRRRYLQSLMARAPTAAAAESLSMQVIALEQRHHATADIVGDEDVLAHAALDRGDMAAATRYLRSEVALADSLAGWRPLRSTVYERLGRALLKQGRYADAIRALRAALRMVDPDDPYVRGDIYHNLAHVYDSEGAIWPAVNAVNRFAELASPLVQDGISIIALYDAGLIRWKAGLHASSRLAFERMVRLIDARRSYYYYAGEYYERIGDFPEARRYYSLVRSGNDEEGARALTGLVRAFEALGMTDSAEAAARRHDAARQTPEEAPLAPTVLAANGQRAKAIALARDWLAAQLARRNIQGGAAAALLVSRLSLAGGDFAGALTGARAADSLAAAANVPEDRLDAATLASRADVALGRTAEAIGRLHAVSRLAAEQPPSAITCDYFTALGDALAAGGRRDEALMAYSEAAGQVERMTGRFDEDLDRARFHGERMAPFDGALRLLLRNAPLRVDVEAMLRWSARRKRALAGPSVSARSGLHAREVTVAALRRALGATGVFVGYAVIDSSVVALSIDREHASVTRLPVSPGQLAREQEALRGPMRAYLGYLDLARAHFDRGLSYRMYAQLMAPLEHAFPPHARLYISPDGPVHLVPFDALATDTAARRATASTSMLVDRYEISYVPSAATLVAHLPDDETTARRGRLLVVATGVPGEREEVAGVTAAWADPGRTVVRADRAATRAAIAASARSFDVIHFATHAAADMADPLVSHLELARTAHDDGLLDLGEIERLRLRARLVVLSGCETEPGPVYGGGGPIGLAQAFLWGGAGAVVATRWPIGAPAAAFMKEFYTQLRAGRDEAAALRLARQRLRADPATSSPFVWGSFVLIDGAH